ncbi:unnamed protein product [Mycena citricolor]|uniref:50S ribosomal protein L35 n=1 Tax=Mycena citricolor TaxID=2018698 RepID=A0AAD2HYF6_9AGAR|nr:unnamed protein product [Mycena citricolor]
MLSPPCGSFGNSGRLPDGGARDAKCSDTFGGSAVLPTLILGIFTMLGALQHCTSRLWSLRSFSTTPVVEAGYKMKTHSGAKKRWRSSVGSGKFKRGQAFRQHLHANKPPARLNRLGNTVFSTPTQTHKLKKVLLPYGSG